MLSWLPAHAMGEEASFAGRDWRERHGESEAAARTAGGEALAVAEVGMRVRGGEATIMTRQVVAVA